MLFQNSVNMVNLFGVTVPQPRILLDFLGFETHVRQIRAKRGVSVSKLWYDHAAYYVVDLPAQKLFGPGEDIVIPPLVKAPDYEFEIGCLATESALLTNEQDALRFIDTYCYFTILNDWSARDIQKKDMEGLGPTNSKFVIGKSIGPALVKTSELKLDANGVFDMEMILSVNGEERSRSNYQTLYHNHPETGNRMAWSFARIFAWLGKQNIAIQPGYLFGSGTVGNGCIAEFAATFDPTTGDQIAPAVFPWLKNGDVVRMEVEGLGVLENRVVSALEF